MDRVAQEGVERDLGSHGILWVPFLVCEVWREGQQVTPPVLLYLSSFCPNI